MPNGTDPWPSDEVIKALALYADDHATFKDLEQNEAKYKAIMRSALEKLQQEQESRGDGSRPQFVLEELGWMCYLQAKPNGGGTHLGLAEMPDEEVVLLARAGLLRPLGDAKAVRALLNANPRAEAIWDKRSYTTASAPMLRVEPTTKGGA